MWRTHIEAIKEVLALYLLLKILPSSYQRINYIVYVASYVVGVARLRARVWLRQTSPQLFRGTVKFCSSYCIPRPVNVSPRVNLCLLIIILLLYHYTGTITHAAPGFLISVREQVSYS